MGKKMQNIYEYLCNYTEKEIDDTIQALSIEEQILIKDRYGEDLHNPVKNDNFNQNKRHRFYAYLIPKMKRILAERKVADLEAKISENSDLNLKNQLLELLKCSKTNEEICNTLNINTQQLYHLLLDLKNNGAMISRKYYSDGSIQYKEVSSIGNLISFFRQDTSIITEYEENNLKFLVISDLHFGNKLERLDLVNRAYEYCVKNGINIILSCGDLLDGGFSHVEQKITDLHQQIEYFIKNYPYDKNIFTLSVAGDHDWSLCRKSALNIIEICNNFRHDIIIGGYGNSIINIKNDQILLNHYINDLHKNLNLEKENVPLILRGHYHKFTTEFDMKNNILYVKVPSLSDIINSMPTALELNLTFKKGYIDNAIIKQIYFGTQDIVLNESTFDLLSNRNVNYEPIKNIKPLKK